MKYYTLRIEFYENEGAYSWIHVFDTYEEARDYACYSCSHWTEQYDDYMNKEINKLLRNGCRKFHRETSNVNAVFDERFNKYLVEIFSVDEYDYWDELKASISVQILTEKNFRKIDKNLMEEMRNEIYGYSN